MSDPRKALQEAVGLPRPTDLQIDNLASFAHTAGDTDLLALIGEVVRLRGLLARLEWAGRTHDDVAACPACGSAQRTRHGPGCWLAAELHPKRKKATSLP